MIIWINGAFGSGKTTIANWVHAQLKYSFLYDAENIGDFFRHNLPKAIQKEDFQDYKEWRSWNITLLNKMNEEYHGDIIVPMSLYKKAYFHEIMNGLKKQGIPVQHFQLEVSKEEIKKRLQTRNEHLIHWGESRLDEILTFFETIPIKEKILNQNRSPKLVAQEIIKKAKKS